MISSKVGNPNRSHFGERDCNNLETRSSPNKTTGKIPCREKILKEPCPFADAVSIKG